MDWLGTRRHRLPAVVLAARVVGAMALASALAFAPSPADRTSGVPQLGTTAAFAQGGMDVGIMLPSFSELPYSVLPGQSFTIGVTTAPGARCAGTMTFRGQQPIELADSPAPGGSCAWTVEVPPDARPGTGVVAVDLSRSGQHWGLSGVVYVSPVGEYR
ncbi:MAG: hypothetical protein U0893_18750 [Chloroflexota bacterium]